MLARTALALLARVHVGIEPHNIQHLVVDLFLSQRLKVHNRTKILDLRPPVKPITESIWGQVLNFEFKIQDLTPLEYSQAGLRGLTEGPLVLELQG
jgi:hypothetical protein